jgi:uncharacterized protein YlxP (DUF503 family)
MTVASLRLDLRVVNCRSQGEKRRRMRVMMDKVHRSFNVSVAALEPAQDPLQITLAVVAVARTRREVRDLLARVADAVAVFPGAEILSHDITEV